MYKMYDAIIFISNTNTFIFSLRVNDIKHVRSFLNPIITITEHSGITSPDINFYKVSLFDFYICQYFVYIIFCIKDSYNILGKIF